MTAPTTEPPQLSPAARIGRAPLRSRLTPQAAIPFLLLLLALSSVFLSRYDRGQFYRYWHHDILTMEYMTLAGNLSPKHGFLSFYSRTLDDDGDPSYHVYGRFPIGASVLLKLAMAPFGDDFSARLRSARTLMLVFFVLGAVSAYLALCRLLASRWVALAATLTAFSSYYMLYYNDMVSVSHTSSLFGVMLAFHGMVVFVREGRFRQLVVKSCAALLLGWHVYALLLAFIVLGLARGLIEALPLFPRFGRSDRAPEAPTAPGRYLALGAITLLFGTALLSFNLGNEYFALGGRVPLSELPTVDSMFRRSGLNEEWNAVHAETLAWPRYLEGQFRRIGGMTIPYGWIEPVWARVVDHPHEMEFLPGVFAWGVVASGACLLGLPLIRRKLLTAALALSGFGWALPMRHHAAFHEFDAAFHVGIPLTVFSFIFLCIRRLIGERFVPVLAAAALPAFVLSSVEMAGVGIRGFAAAAEADVRRDFEVMRDVLEEGVLYIPPGQRRKVHQKRLRYLLADSVILLPGQWRQRELAGFVMLRHRDEGPALLTPDNRQMFLYDRTLFDASYDEQALGSPIIASEWNVYRKDDRLIYVSEDCAHRKAPFFLAPTPREADEPPERDERRAFDGKVFRWKDIVRRSDRICVGVIELPERDLASVRTGQLHDGEPLWEGEHRFER